MSKKLGKLYLGRYQHINNKVKIGTTFNGMGTRASQITQNNGNVFSPLLFARFENITKPELVLLESQLRVMLSNTNGMEFIETSNDHFKTTLKNEELEDLFLKFVRNSDYYEKLKDIQFRNNSKIEA